MNTKKFVNNFRHMSPTQVLNRFVTLRDELAKQGKTDDWTFRWKYMSNYIGFYRSLPTIVKLKDQFNLRSETFDPYIPLTERDLAKLKEARSVCAEIRKQVRGLRG